MREKKQNPLEEEEENKKREKRGEKRDMAACRLLTHINRRGSHSVTYAQGINHSKKKI